MDPQQPPLDIKITIGSNQTAKGLLDVQAYLIQDQQKLKQSLQNWKISEQQANNCGLFVIVDLQVELGKEKEAIQYLDRPIQKGCSTPLQLLLKNSSLRANNNIKKEFQQKQGYIRVLYRYPTKVQQNHRFEDVCKFTQAFEEKKFDCNNNMKMSVKGELVHKEDNRVGVKVDFAKIQLLSNTMIFKDFFQSLLAMDSEFSDFQQIFKFTKRLKTAKVDLKFKDFGEMRRFYAENSKNKKKNKKLIYECEGIFKNWFKCSIVFDNKYILEVNGRYQNEQVFMRFITVFTRFVQALKGQTYI